MASSPAERLDRRDFDIARTFFSAARSMPDRDQPHCSDETLLVTPHLPEPDRP